MDNDTDYSKYIIPLGVIALGYTLYNKFFGSGSGSGQDNAITVNTTQGAVQTSLQQSQAVTPATLTDAQAASIANTIFSLGTQYGFPITNDTADQIVWQVLEVNNLTDLLLIMKYFQTRAVNTGGWLSLCAVANISCTQVDLSSFLHALLNQVNLNKINSFLAMTSINYQF